MQNFRKVTDNFYVAPQLTADDMHVAKEEGFEAFIMNRPDRETPDQPPTQDLVSVAEEYGLPFLHIPITAPPSPHDIAATQQAISDLSGKKILAFCRSGTRSVTLWAYAMAAGKTEDVGTILNQARDAGYDLSPHRSQLQALYDQ